MSRPIRHGGGHPRGCGGPGVCWRCDYKLDEHLVVDPPVNLAGVESPRLPIDVRFDWRPDLGQGVYVAPCGCEWAIDHAVRAQCATHSPTHRPNPAPAPAPVLEEALV